MMNWLIALVIVAAVTVPSVILLRRHAPKWVIWAMWAAWGALWFGVAALTTYGPDPVPIAVVLVVGATVGFAGGQVAAPPFVRTPRAPGRYQGGARRRWRRKYLH